MWCYWKEHFPKHVCERIINQLKDEVTQDARVTLKGIKDPNIRKADLTWLEDEKYAYIYDNIWGITREINEDLFNFHLTNMESIQFTKYDSSRGGFYKPHQDVFWLDPRKDTHRKLTCVVQLSDPKDYTGGDLVLHECEIVPDPDEVKAQGTVIFFPSFVMHEVKPVLTGVRYTLVCWIYGPKWR